MRSDEREIIEAVRRLAKEKQIDIPSLTEEQIKEMVGLFEVFLAVMAERGRKEQRHRQAEGIEKAKALGVKFGRPRKPLPPNFLDEVRRYHETAASLRDCAAACGMPVSTFYQQMKKPEREGKRPL